MGKAPADSGSCCLPNLEGVTYLKIGSRGITVGMMGLDRVFEQLVALNRNPEQALDAELVGTARRFNYISDRPQIEADYAAALRRAYAAYYVRQEKRSE
jgi:hypothetical protein